MKKVECTEEIAVRGRNGYFDLRRVEITLFGSNVYIGMYSKRRGLSAPVCIYGSREAVHGIFAEICHLLNRT